MNPQWNSIRLDDSDTSRFVRCVRHPATLRGVLPLKSQIAEIWSSLYIMLLARQNCPKGPKGLQSVAPLEFRPP